MPPEKSSEPPQSLFRRLRRLVHSRVFRYRAYNVRLTRLRANDEHRRNDPIAAGTPGDSFVGTDPAAAHADRVAASRRAVDAFLRMLPERSGLPPQQVVFVVDGIRPYRYTEGWEHRWNGSYHDVMRRYFMDEARADDYEVIDMRPVFVDHYRSHRQPFNWLRDNHWNALGHGLCAEQVAWSQALISVAGRDRRTRDGEMTERADDAPERREDFAQQLDQAEQLPFLVELWQFMRDNKKWAASGIRVGSERVRVEVEPSQMEVDGVAEPLAVAIPAGLPLDPLDLGVDAL